METYERVRKNIEAYEIGDLDRTQSSCRAQNRYALLYEAPEGPVKLI